MVVVRLNLSRVYLHEILPFLHMILSQNRPHVPKFGGWDNDNVPYTAFFDNARKERSGMRMNPNDPEENPEAFMHARAAMEDDVDFFSRRLSGIYCRRSQH